MFGLPIVLAAFALMGAPAVLPVGCNPVTTAAHSAEGLTWYTPDRTRPTRIDFAPEVCGGLTYLAASPFERVKLRALNPLVDFDRFAGVALVVVLHESHHAGGMTPGTVDHDEARTECIALRELPAFAATWAPAGELPTMLAWSRLYDASLPAAYHGATC